MVPLELSHARRPHLQAPALAMWFPSSFCTPAVFVYKLWLLYCPLFIDPAVFTNQVLGLAPHRSGGLRSLTSTTSLTSITSIVVVPRILYDLLLVDLAAFSNRVYSIGTRDHFLTVQLYTFPMETVFELFADRFLTIQLYTFPKDRF